MNRLLFSLERRGLLERRSWKILNNSLKYLVAKNFLPFYCPIFFWGGVTGLGTDLDLNSPKSLDPHS